MEETSTNYIEETATRTIHTNIILKDELTNEKILLPSHEITTHYERIQIK